MKRILLAAALLLFALTAPVFAADAYDENNPPKGAHFSAPGTESVEIGTTLQFMPVGKAPEICHASTRGTLALTRQMRLCVCDGKQWAFESSGEACAW